MSCFNLLKVVIGVALSVSLLGAIGCESPEPAEPVEQVQQAPPPPPEPHLAAARDAQLTLFGEFPDRQRVPFVAQAASPMKQHSFAAEGADFDVDVAPDGNHLVFASTRHTPRPNLYLKTIDGRAVTQLTDDPASDVQPAFSPDGKQIAFASSRSGNWDLWMVSLQGGRATQITHSPQHEVHPSFSPDGTRLAYCQFNERSDTWELWVLDLSQPDSRKMIGLGLFPEWSPTSDSIVYQRARQRGGRWFSVWRVDLVDGEPAFPVEIASSVEMALIQPSWSPNGQWITYGTAQLSSPPPVADVPEPDADGETVVDQAPPAPRDVTMSRGDVWIVRADGSGAVQLTEGEGVNFGSVWGTDQRVYFTSLRNGSENVWSVLPMMAAPEPLTATQAGPAPAASSETAVSNEAVAPASGRGSGAVQANRGG